MELKRTFYTFLKHWKATKKQECLLVNGARQIGKTYIIEKFGRENYESFIEINFALEPECISIFEGNLSVRSICERLTAIRGDARLIPGRTLIFLDEIQDCPNARTAFKSFALDGRYDVIGSGSLLGIKYKKNKINRTPRSIPVGFENQVTMYSLSFEEYLDAKGFGAESRKLIERCFPIKPTFRRLKTVFWQYRAFWRKRTVSSSMRKSKIAGRRASICQAWSGCVTLALPRRPNV